MAIKEEEALEYARRMEKGYESFRYIKEVLETVVLAKERVKKYEAEAAKVEAESKKRVVEAETQIATVDERTEKARAEHAAKVEKLDTEFKERAASYEKKIAGLETDIRSLEQELDGLKKTRVAEAERTKAEAVAFRDQKQKEMKALDEKIAEREALLEKINTSIKSSREAVLAL